ncbi:MAG: response regulator [Lachnospiraceae bacterium]|nr:response regulator [Lachnospiraceae bacterium]
MKKSALVVDDNNTNLMVISDLLEAFGVDCVKAASGEEAIGLINYFEEKQEDRLSFVLMDYIMPGMNGVEATRTIKKIKKIPVYGMSGDVTDQLIELYKEAGAVDAVIKPIRPDVMYRIVCECLNEGDYLVPKKLLDIHENVPEGQSLLKECLKGVPGIDYEKGVKTALGKESSYLRLLKASVSNIREYAEILKDYVKSSDSFQLKLASHSLKTVFANIGIDKLKIDSEVVESAAEKLTVPENNLSQAPAVPSIMFYEHVHSYMVNVLAAADAIERATAEYDKITNSDVDKSSYILAEEPLDARDRAEVISYTFNALNRFEFDYILEGLEILKKASTGDERIRLEKAIDALNNYDYDRVRTIVTEISST